MKIAKQLLDVVLNVFNYLDDKLDKLLSTFITKEKLEADLRLDVSILEKFNLGDSKLAINIKEILENEAKKEEFFAYQNFRFKLYITLLTTTMTLLAIKFFLNNFAKIRMYTPNATSDFFISANRSFVAGKEYVGSSIKTSLDYASELWNAFKDKVSNKFNSARTTATQAVGTVQTKATQVVESARTTATQAASYLPNKPQLFAYTNDLIEKRKVNQVHSVFQEILRNSGLPKSNGPSI